MSVATASRWVRAKNGWFAGVCQGVANHFGIEAWIIRAFWLLSICWFGVGVVLYFAMAFSLPREDKMDEAMNKKFLGVCRNIAMKYNSDIGLVRLAMVLLALSSFGMALFLYIVLAVVMPKEL